MATFKVTGLNGDIVPVEKIVKTNDPECKCYDPFGRYDHTSNVYCANYLDMLKKKGKIKDFEIIGEMDKFESVPGRIY